VLGLLGRGRPREVRLSEADLTPSAPWVERTNIRWSADEQLCSELGLPTFRWRAGLDRLLLGYSMAGGGERMFAGILPYDDLEGGAATVLGHFVEFTTRVFATVEELAAARPLDEWVATFDAILDRFFQASDASEHERQTLRDAFQPLRRQREDAGFAAPVGGGCPPASRAGGGSLRGRLSHGQRRRFAAKPMRSIRFDIFGRHERRGLPAPARIT
jgi:exodeoxyribonuclease V gamma subunit